MKDFVRYKSLNQSRTCIGVDSAASFVKPTISLKNIVTISNVSACTVSPCFNCSATVLCCEKMKKRKRNQVKFTKFPNVFPKKNIESLDEKIISKLLF